MNNTKKIIAIAMVVVLIFSMTACKKKTASPSGDNSFSQGESSDLSNLLSSEPFWPSEQDDSKNSGESSNNKKPETSNGTSNRPPNPGNTTNGKTKVYKVEDFGAKGDGKTNDGIAITEAINAAAADTVSKEKIVEFKSNATYRIAQIPKNNYYNYFISLDGVDNVKVRGNNTKLLMKAPLRVVSFENTNNCEMSGFVIDYFPKPFIKGTVVSNNSNDGYMDFKVNEDLGFSGNTFTPSNSDFFAFRNRSNERRHYFITKYEKRGNGICRAYIASNSVGNIGVAQINEEFILPVANNSHDIGGIGSFSGNNECTVKNVKVVRAPDFGFALRLNVGKMYFTNVDFVKDPDAGINLVQWRDGFHVKDNTAPIVWDGCDIGPLGDDAYNLSTVNLNVNTVSADSRTIGMVAAEGKSERPAIKAGDDFVAYNLKDGTEIGRGKVEKVIPSGDPICFRSNVALPNLKRGMQIGVYSYANPGAVIKNSTVEGTVRVRSFATFENVRFSLFWLRVENESYIEGPVPKDILFKRCTFSTPYTGTPNIFIVQTINAYGGNNCTYKCKNIVLEACTFTNGKYTATAGNELIIK